MAWQKAKFLQRRPAYGKVAVPMVMGLGGAAIGGMVAGTYGAAVGYLAGSIIGNYMFPT